MKIQKEELVAVLGEFNPWWRQEPVSDLPTWQRASFKELHYWVINPPAPRAIFLSGARQVGKTTLLMQAIQALLKAGTPAGNIVYATFDHPIFKLAGIDAVLDAWREREAKQPGQEYIFLDEAQFVPHWGTWVKHQVDFFKQRRIVFTGSAMPLLEADQESGVGRWHNIRLTTLSFYEYVRLKNIDLPALPQLSSLRALFDWSAYERRQVAERAQPYLAHFHQYLVQGGFPQTAVMASVTQAQRLLREDIIDKAIKRDMTAIFKVRHVLELEQTFLYLCRHDGGILDVSTLSRNLEVARGTAQNYIRFFEASHLLYRLEPLGYGKEILRGHYKVYLADAAIAPAVMLKGRAIIEDPAALGVAAEAAVFKHLFARYYSQNIRFSYWRDKRGEVDIVADIAGHLTPFEVKYRNPPHDAKTLKGIVAFCAEKPVERGYIVTKSIEDFGLLMRKDPSATPLLCIPAALLCYWMGEMELRGPQ